MNATTGALIHDLHSGLNRVADVSLKKEVGISYTWFFLLFTIGQNVGSTQHQIAAALGVSDAAVSKLCAEGANLGLLEINTNPAHKKQRLVRLTHDGRKTLAQSLLVLDACLSDICQRANVDEEGYKASTYALLESLKTKESV